MSWFGRPSLKKLIIRYCDIGGSSSGVWCAQSGGGERAFWPGCAGAARAIWSAHLQRRGGAGAALPLLLLAHTQRLLIKSPRLASNTQTPPIAKKGTTCGATSPPSKRRTPTSASRRRCGAAATPLSRRSSVSASPLLLLSCTLCFPLSRVPFVLFSQEQRSWQG